MWLEHDPKKIPQFRNCSWLLKVFWNQDLNFVSLTYLSKIPGTGASENICTVIRTLGKPRVLIFVSECYQNRWTSPYWYSTWIETIPKQWIYFGNWGNFFSCWKYCSWWLDEWNDFFSSHLKNLPGNVYTYESSFSNPDQGLSVLLCWSYWGKNLNYCLKRKYSAFDQLALIENCFPAEYKQQRVWNPGSFMLTHWLVLCNFMQDMFLVSFHTSRVSKCAPWGAGE